MRGKTNITAVKAVCILKQAKKEVIIIINKRN
jgi:hypothetical protein